MKLYDAQEIAERYRQMLAPHCHPGRCVIGGSLRRERDEIKDIEIICIPKRVLVSVATEGADLFGPAIVHPSKIENTNAFVEIVEKWPKVKGDARTGKYTQRVLPEGIKLDLFMVVTDNWGAQLLIRTGNWAYSKWFMGSALRRAGYEMRDGFVHQGDRVIPVLEEVDMFRLAKVQYVEPMLRNR